MKSNLPSGISSAILFRLWVIYATTLLINLSLCIELTGMFGFKGSTTELMIKNNNNIQPITTKWSLVSTYRYSHTNM